MPSFTDFRPTPNIPIALGHQSQKRLRPELPADLGKCIRYNFIYLEELGCKKLICSTRGSSNFGYLNFNHPTKRLLKNYKGRGAPVKLRTKPWTLGRLQRSLCSGFHKSTYKYLDFLQEEFVEMTNKGQWVILPYDKLKDLSGLCLYLPCCVFQCYRRPPLYCDGVDKWLLIRPHNMMTIQILRSAIVGHIV